MNGGLLPSIGNFLSSKGHCEIGGGHLKLSAVVEVLG